MRRACFDDVIYLPFEGLDMPCPVGYKEVLTDLYGDWHKFVRGTSFHEDALFSTDIPWQEYLRQVDFA